jgi:hypothetical protein
MAATDASGRWSLKRSWRETNYRIKATESWVKTHAVIEVDSYVVPSYRLTSSNVQESEMFEDV